MSLRLKDKNYDVIGIAAAFVCMVHCMLFPLLFFIPIGISHNPYVDLIFLTIGIWSVYKTTKTSTVFLQYLLWCSIALISFSVVLHIVFNKHSTAMYTGALGLVIGHLLNYRNHIKSHK